jgi:hypothetical protein
MLGPTSRIVLEDAADELGNSRANSAFAIALGEFDGVDSVEFVVTDPRSGRNGRATMRTMTQNAMGYHGWRRMRRASPPKSRVPPDSPWGALTVGPTWTGR